jgi:NADH-quinone oxidoreductase subunit J
VGALLFNRYVLPFEAISILLLAAMVGAIVLSQHRKPAKSAPGSTDAAAPTQGGPGSGA